MATRYAEHAPRYGLIFFGTMPTCDMEANVQDRMVEVRDFLGASTRGHVCEKELRHNTIDPEVLLTSVATSNLQELTMEDGAQPDTWTFELSDSKKVIHAGLFVLLGSCLLVFISG